MPESTSAAFDREWEDPRGRTVDWFIEYRRRFSNGSAFVVEPTPKILFPWQLVSMTPVVHAEDGASSLTLFIRNIDQEWLTSNTIDSIYRKDLVALEGYENTEIEFVLKYGYQLPNGTIEYLTRFTGYSEIPVLDSDTGAAEVRLTGREFQARKFIADEELSTDLTGQPTTPTHGDGATTTFLSGKKSTFAPILSILSALTVTLNTNDAIDFDEGGAELNATIAAASYKVAASDAVSGSLNEAIKTALEAAGAGTYSVTFDLATLLFTITQDTGPTSPATFNILWKTGTNGADGTDQHAGTLLGYSDAADDTGATAYAADTAQVPVVQDQGSAYTLEEVRNADSDLEFVFEEGAEPAATDLLIWSGTQLLRNATISNIAGLICDSFGVLPSERSIEEPTFGDVDQSNTITAQAEWEAGILVDIAVDELDADSISIEGNTIDDFTDGDFTNNPVWTEQGGTGEWSVVSERLQDSSGTTGKSISTPFTETTGTLRMSIVFSGFSRTAEIFWVVNNANPYNASAEGYVFSWSRSAFPGGTLSIRLEKFTGGAAFVNRTLITQLNNYIAGAGGVAVMTRDSSGNFEFLDNGVSRITATDLTYTAGTHLSLSGRSGFSAVTATFDEIRFLKNTTGTWTSAEIDLLAAPTEWLPIAISQTLNGGTLVVKTSTSATSGSGFEAAVAVDGFNVPQSTKQRFFKWVIEFTAASNKIDSPNVQDVRVNFRSAALFVAQADFKGLDNWESLKLLGELAGGMDIGFHGDGSFYFQNPEVTVAPDFVVSETNAISKITNLEPGDRDVRTVITVRYGEGRYESKFDSDSAGESFPKATDRFGRKQDTIDGGTLFFANSADITAAVAQRSYDQQSTAKRTCKYVGRVIPALRIRDTLEASFKRTPLLGDVMPYDLMQETPPYSMDENGPSNVLLQKVNFKARSGSMDYWNGSANIDLQEVLS